MVTTTQCWRSFPHMNPEFKLAFFMSTELIVWAMLFKRNPSYLLTISHLPQSKPQENHDQHQESFVPRNGRCSTHRNPLQGPVIEIVLSSRRLFDVPKERERSIATSVWAGFRSRRRNYESAPSDETRPQATAY